MKHCMKCVSWLTLLYCLGGMKPLHTEGAIQTIFLEDIVRLRTTVVSPIKEITSEQRTRFNVPNGDFAIVLIYS